MEFKDKKVLVIGLAKSGLWAIRLLHKLGVTDITLTEQKEIKTGKEELEQYGVKFLPQCDETFDLDYDLVIKNPAVPPVSPFLKKFSDRNIPVISEVELAYMVSKPQHYVGITGTNGKTTTTTLVYEIMHKAFGDKALVGGNIGFPLCELVMEHNLMEEEGYYISIELSNHQLIDMPTFRSEISTIVNLTPDHVKTMGSLENYYYSKTKVYLNQKADDLFLLNADDAVLKEYMEKYPVPCQTMTFSLEKNDTDARLEDGWIVIDGEKVIEQSKITLPGMHNVQNIMIASMACRRLGISIEDIQDVIYSFKGVEHRIEFVRELDGVRYYNDSKGTNTDATITALKAFDKGVILLVGGFEKGLSMDEMRNYLGCVKQVIGYGAAGERISHDLVGDEAIVVTTLDEAVAEAKKLAVTGDTVLLSPTTSSFDQYSCFEERGEHFKKIVRNL